MILKGRSISSGKAEGTVLKLDGAFSFLGGADGSTGDLKVADGNLKGKIFVFPKGKGSTVGSFTMYDLKVHGVGPAAVVNQDAETIVATGAVISSIPMVDRIDVGLIRNGDRMVVDGTEGTVELPDVRLIETASSAILVNGKVLLLKRPATAGSYPGRWSLVAGKLEEGEDAEHAAVREVMEETGIRVGGPAAKAPPFMQRDGDIIWVVHPFLFIPGPVSPVLNDENVGYMWAEPDRLPPDTVPQTEEKVRMLLGLNQRRS